MPSMKPVYANRITHALVGLAIAVIPAACSPTDVPGGAESCIPRGNGLLKTATWEYVYTNYFGPGTPGHCGNSKCHRDRALGGFLAGTTSDSCSLGLLGAHLINYDCPQRSLILDSQRS